MIKFRHKDYTTTLERCIGIKRNLRKAKRAAIRRHRENNSAPFIAADINCNGSQALQLVRLGVIEVTGQRFSDHLICINEEEGLFKKTKINEYTFKMTASEIAESMTTLEELRKMCVRAKLEKKLKKIVAEINDNGLQYNPETLEIFA